MNIFLKNYAAIFVGISAFLFLTSALPASPERFDSATVNEVASDGTSSIELPPAQEVQCKSTQTTGPALKECLTANRALASMSAEPRDKAWARQTESFLQGWIESLADQGFTARNVECRLSWCIVEVSSTQPQSLILKRVEARKKNLFQFRSYYAPDNSVSDSNVTDVFVIFKRYCRSTSELIDHDGNQVADFDSQGKTC